MRKLTVVLVLVLAVGCKEWPSMPAGKESKTEEPVGRYQVVTGRSDTFLVDTVRGRTWTLVGPYKRGDHDYEPHFHPLTIIDEEGKLGMSWSDWVTLPARWEKATQDFEVQAILDKAAKEVAAAEKGKKDSAKHE